MLASPNLRCEQRGAEIFLHHKQCKLEHGQTTVRVFASVCMCFSNMNSEAKRLTSYSPVQKLHGIIRLRPNANAHPLT
jgi:hypothetical protein